MAILKFVNPKKYKAKGIKNITAYVLRLGKKAHNDGLDKPDKLLAWGVNVNPHRAADQMEETKSFWQKKRGREYYHFIMSYPPDEDISLKNALVMGREFVETCVVRNKDGTERKVFDGYEVLIAAHHDKDNHIDVHFIINSVSLADGQKFRYTTREGAEMKQFQDEMNVAAGYKRAPKKGENYKYEKRTGIVENKRDSYEFLLEAENYKVESYIKNCANAVLSVIKAKPGSREEFINKMNENGFETEWTDNRKHVTFTAKARKNGGEIKCKVRLAKLFDIYNLEEFKKEYIEAEINKNSKSVIEKHTEETKGELVESITVKQIETEEQEQEILKMPEIDESKVLAKEDEKMRIARKTGEFCEKWTAELGSLTDSEFAKKGEEFKKLWSYKAMGYVLQDEHDRIMELVNEWPDLSERKKLKETMEDPKNSLRSTSLSIMPGKAIRTNLKEEDFERQKNAINVIGEIVTKERGRSLSSELANATCEFLLKSPFAAEYRGFIAAEAKVREERIDANAAKEAERRERVESKRKDSRGHEI